MSTIRKRSALGAAAGGLLLAVALVTPAAAHGPSVKVIATGLDNPRGIAVNKDGKIFVAQAGAGGPGGYGTSGKIITIGERGKVRTYLGGLPSAISPEGEATGPVGIDVRDGKVVATIGGGPQDVDPRFDTLVRVRQSGAKVLSDIQAFRNAHPDATDLDQPPNPTDSNAYGVAALSRGRTLVTDAAGNDLLLIGSKGKTVTVAKFPNALVSTSHLPAFLGVTDPMLPAEAVPTSVAVGPDGYWYVGELKGFPFTPGASRIWRVAPWARNVTCDPAAKHGPCTVFADGFTSIVGLDFGRDGSLYVVEIVKSSVINLFLGSDDVGALIRVKHGHRTEIAAGQLHVPGGVAAGGKGTVYVTTNSISVGGGQVVRIRH